MAKVQNSLELLHPAFRAKVERVLTRMRAKGHTPVVFETRRSFERAEELAKRGSGVRRSMHCYDIAVDIVDGYRATKEESLWQATPEFWRDLGEAYEAEGLVWGGKFKKADKPHGQAVAIWRQAAVRQMSKKDLDALIRKLHALG